MPFIKELFIVSIIKREKLSQLNFGFPKIVIFFYKKIINNTTAATTI